jgi:hypothetical protein
MLFKILIEVKLIEMKKKIILDFSIILGFFQMFIQTKNFQNNKNKNLKNLPNLVSLEERLLTNKD